MFFIITFYRNPNINFTSQVKHVFCNCRWSQLVFESDFIITLSTLPKDLLLNLHNVINENAAIIKQRWSSRFNFKGPSRRASFALNQFIITRQLAHHNAEIDGSQLKQFSKTIWYTYSHRDLDELIRLQEYWSYKMAGSAIIFIEVWHHTGRHDSYYATWSITWWTSTTAQFYIEVYWTRAGRKRYNQGYITSVMV